MLDALKSLKDKGLGSAMKAMLNDKFKQYGHITDLVVDTRARRVSAALDLVGEREPIQVTLSGYEVLSENGETLVRLGLLDSSRPWIASALNEIADRTLESRCFPIENKAAAELVRKLL